MPGFSFFFYFFLCKCYNGTEFIKKETNGTMNRQDLTLLTDFYELTMMQGYYEEKQNETVIFDVFFRQNPCGNGYSVCAGLE